MHVQTPAVRAFLALCQRDNRLRSSILSLSVYPSLKGSGLLIQPTPGGLVWIRRKLFKIARLLIQTGDFKTITVSGHNRPLTFLISDLADLCPAIFRPPMIHKKNTPDQAYYQALCEYESKHCSVFLISTSGVYLDAVIHQGTTSKIPPDSMKHKPLADVIGKTAANKVLEAVQDAYTLNQSRQIEYSISYADGEVRSYSAQLLPATETNSVIALVNRIR